MNPKAWIPVLVVLAACALGVLGVRRGDLDALEAFALVASAVGVIAAKKHVKKKPKPPAALLLLASLLMTGCAQVITQQDVKNLRIAIEDERRAVVPRPGFEKGISASRSGVDKKLDAMEAATR